MALVLDAEFTHRGMTRAGYPAAVRKREMGAALFQQQNYSLDGYTLGFGEPAPPDFEFIRNLDVPRHTSIITRS